MNKIFSIFIVIIVIGLGIFLFSRGNMNKVSNEKQEQNTDVKVTPIAHATMALEWSGKTIITDPVGDASLFTNVPAPDVILLTDIHPDHLDINAINALVKDKTILVAPQAVVDQIISKLEIGTLVIMANGDKTTQADFSIEAVPMYNIPEKSDSFHTKGRGNGYVLEHAGERIYISGDTSGTPEMKNLKDIDWAFVCMNLPYTMSVEEAASAVLAMKPARVTPYHYRTPEGFSDINKFKSLVNTGNPKIEVMLLDFYPTK
jgi:L-ascorbate metabolism protein UlaG (beta-lactamase superfamily)